MTEHLDDAVCFRRALHEEHDARHAAHHLANLVVAGPSPAVDAAIEEFCNEVADPCSVTELQPQAYVGSAILHALVLARSGRTAEGVSLMMEAQRLAPDADLLSWVQAWMQLPGCRQALDLGELAAVASKPWQASHGARVLKMLDEVRREREPHGILVVMLARLARSLGDLQRAATIADEEHRRCPSFHTCIARVGVHRARGELQAALAACREALTFEGDNLGVQLDAADISLELKELETAAEGYAAVVACEPEHVWAWPSLLYVQALRGDLHALEALAELAQAKNQRARSLMAEIDPYAVELTPPSSAIINAIAHAIDSGLTAGNVAVSSLEPPSAIASAKDAIARAGQSPDGFVVSFAQIPKPDPRRAKGGVRWPLWTYAAPGLAGKLGRLGTEARPALDPPAHDVADAIRTLALQAFSRAAWAQGARAIATRLGELRVRDVLATAVLPPQGPKDIAPWEWRFRVQVAAAFVACRLGSGGWKGTTRAEAMRSMLDGPLDWTAAAAILALPELAREEPDIADVVRDELLGPRLESAQSPIHYQCVVHPLVFSMLRLPNLDDRLRATLLEMRKDL